MYRNKTFVPFDGDNDIANCDVSKTETKSWKLRRKAAR